MLATQSTLDSQKYQELKSGYGKQIQLIEKASPLFVDLVETAPKITDTEMLLIEKELQPFIEAKVDSLVLGCTHYPFLTEAITKIMGGNVELFESGLPVAQEVKRRIQSNLNHSKSDRSIDFYSSDPQKSQAVFNRLLEKSVKIKFF